MTDTLDATVPVYRISLDEDQYTQRIVAVDAQNIEIVGAYRPVGLNDWRLFLTKLVSDTVALPQPHKVHVCSRDDALRWIDLIATLYIRASR
jgi:hypothetical protein